MGRQESERYYYKLIEQALLDQLMRVWAKIGSKEGEEGVFFYSTTYGCPESYQLTEEGLLQMTYRGQAVRINVKPAKEEGLTEIIREERLLHYRPQDSNLQEGKIVVKIASGAGVFDHVFGIDEGSVYQPKRENPDGWLEWSAPGILDNNQLRPVWGWPRRLLLLQQITAELQGLRFPEEVSIPALV